jgi:hypothetical protein
MKSCSSLADMHRTEVLAAGAWTDQIQDKPEPSVTCRVTHAERRGPFHHQRHLIVQQP